MERSRLDEASAGQRLEDGPRLIEVNARGTGQHRFRKTENSSYLLQRGARHVVGETEVLHALMLDRQPERPRIPTPTTRASYGFRLIRPGCLAWAPSGSLCRV